MSIDFSDLEHDPQFRAEYLTYLHLVNRYCASIFWEVFRNGNGQLKKLYEAVVAYDAALKQINPKKGMDKQLLQSLVPSNGVIRSGHLDCFKEDFIQFLRDGLPDSQKKRFEYRLRHTHAIPLRFSEFCDHLDGLKNKRHFLKYWEKQKDKLRKVADRAVVHSLGLFLLPKLHQHFQGAITRHRRRNTVSDASSDPAAVRGVLSHGRRLRREETERLYSDHGSRKALGKNERQGKERSKESWMAKYDSFYPTGVWPRYNYHNFKIRYSFMGKATMGALEQALEQTFPDHRKALHFEWEIEAVYDVMMRVNERLRRAFHLLDVAEKALTTRERKAVGMKGRLRQIFNGISHNEPFFALKDDQGAIPVEDVLTEVFAGLKADHVVKFHGDPNALIGDLYSDLQTMFGKQNFSFAIPTVDGQLQNQPPHVVRRWTKSARATYLESAHWTIDRRVRVKALVAGWRRELDQAFRASRSGKSGPERRKKLTNSPENATGNAAFL